MTRPIGTAALIGAIASVLASVLKGVGERSLQRAAEAL